MWKRKLVRHLLRIVGIVILGGLFSAMLTRAAPGFGVDEQQLDSRLNSSSLQALRAKKARDKHIARFYFSYLSAALHGDLGTSETLNRPVCQLISERLPVTLRLVGAGLLVGWTLGLCLAVSATMMRLNLIDMSATLIAGALVSIPAAVLALAVVFASAPGYVAVGLIILPKVFSYARGLLRRSYAMSHVITARAKGVGAGRILLFHVLPVSGHELFALAGVSVSVALGAAIPVEALCGIPGIGDLAWRAALSRDLPLLVSLTVLVTLATVVANSTSDILTEMLWGQAA